MWNPFQSRKQRPNFFKDDDEVARRTWWFARHVIQACSRERKLDATLTGLAAFDDRTTEEQRRSELLEIVGYTTSFALAKLRDDIEASHGWEREAYDLNLHYQTFLATWIQHEFGLRDN